MYIFLPHFSCSFSNILFKKNMALPKGGKTSHGGSFGHILFVLLFHVFVIVFLGLQSRCLLPLFLDGLSEGQFLLLESFPFKPSSSLSRSGQKSQPVPTLCQRPRHGLCRWWAGTSGKHSPSAGHSVVVGCGLS